MEMHEKILKTKIVRIRTMYPGLQYLNIFNKGIFEKVISIVKIIIQAKEGVIPLITVHSH